MFAWTASLLVQPWVRYRVISQALWGVTRGNMRGTGWGGGRGTGKWWGGGGECEGRKVMKLFYVNSRFLKLLVGAVVGAGRLLLCPWIMPRKRVDVVNLLHKEDYRYIKKIYAFTNFIKLIWNKSVNMMQTQSEFLHRPNLKNWRGKNQCPQNL